MRVLLTGASGFLGRRLTTLLASDGHEVIGASNERVDLEHAARVLTLDISDAEAVRKLASEVSPDVIVHLAGLANVGASWRRPGDYFRVNVLGTENVLDAFPGVKLLLASSAEVYGDVPGSEQPLAEDRDPAPANPYALTKAAAERLVLARGGAVMRLFTVIGPGQSRRFALPSFAEQLAELHCSGGGRMKVGNLAARRDFLHVGDAVAAISLLASSDLPEQIYNVGGGEVASLQNLLERLIEIAGVDARIEVDPERLRPIDIPLLSGDGSRLRRLGWRPIRSLDEALAELWVESLEAVSASA